MKDLIEPRLSISTILEDLRARLPVLPVAPSPMEEADRRELKLLVRDAGRALNKLRRLPRAETASLARFREACRAALAAGRDLERARRKLESAARRLKPGD